MMRVVVESFSILREDCSERNAPSLRKSDTFHTSDNFLLKNARLTASASLGMNEIAQVSCLVDFLDFALFLHDSESDNRLYKFL